MLQSDLPKVQPYELGGNQADCHQKHLQLSRLCQKRAVSLEHSYYQALQIPVKEILHCIFVCRCLNIDGHAGSMMTFCNRG